MYICTCKVHSGAVLSSFPRIDSDLGLCVPSTRDLFGDFHRSKMATVVLSSGDHPRFGPVLLADSCDTQEKRGVESINKNSTASRAPILGCYSKDAGCPRVHPRCYYSVLSSMIWFLLY